MPGAGAFRHPPYYGPATAGQPTNNRVRSAMCGIQRLIGSLTDVDLGVSGRYDVGSLTDADLGVSGRYDQLTTLFVRAFQQQHAPNAGPVDGLYGPRTSKLAIGFLCDQVEVAFGLPGPYLHGYCHWEGNWDPGAQGYATPSDYGVVQVNIAVQDVTVHQACAPLWAVPWCARQLVARYKSLHDWDAAIIGHRSPLWAQCQAGLRDWPEPYFDSALGKTIDPRQEAQTYIERVKHG